MKAQLIIEKGQARLLTPVYLRDPAPRVFEIEIPDEAVAPSRDWFPDEIAEPLSALTLPAAEPGSLQAELNAMLGTLARVRPGASIGEDQHVLLDALEERHGSH